jgi:hypothetical protein
MSYFSDGITIADDRAFHGGRTLRVRTTHADKIIQCYVSGELVASAVPYQGSVEFTLTESLATDMVGLLAVDADGADENYWDQAFGTDLARVSRIKVQTPQLSLAYMPGDVWKVYVGAAGQAEADRLAHAQAFFPGGRGSGGYGIGYGDAYGFDASGARGYGANFGRGEYGFDCDMLTWMSEPMPPGVYPVEVLVASACGNDSPSWTTEATITSYARPAVGLTVDSYDPSGDRLGFSFTESEDIN